MKLIIHDLNRQDFDALRFVIDADTIVVSDNGAIKNCIGCFGCWIKTPGTCVLKDSYNEMGKLLAQCDTLIIISKCSYGSYSPFVRNVWDRSLPYLLPYFVTKNNETHHKQRYKKRINYTAHFYGDDITENEKQTAKTLVHANAKNFYLDVVDVYFHQNTYDMKGAAQ
jgi:multimeric flavodoxin WrbA